MVKLTQKEDELIKKIEQHLFLHTKPEGLRNYILQNVTRKEYEAFLSKLLVPSDDAEEEMIHEALVMELENFVDAFGIQFKPPMKKPILNLIGEEE